MGGIDGTTYHLPHLDHIIFGGTSNHPRFYWVPSKIGDLICMAIMHKLRQGKVSEAWGDVLAFLPPIQEAHLRHLRRFVLHQYVANPRA